MFKYQLRSGSGMPGHQGIGSDATERQMMMMCTTDTSNGEGNMIIQANLAASKVNGRLYRQARDYRIKLSLITAPLHDAGANVNMEFFTLPNTYFVHGAIKYAFQQYMNGHADEIAAGVKFAKWHDFSINEQNPTGVWEYSAPVLWDGTADSGMATITANEDLSDSSVTDSGGTSQGFNLIGNLANSYNIFREYAKKLNYRPQPGTVSSDQPYDGLLDLDDADDMAEKGDLAPYDRDFSDFIPDDTTVDDDSGQNILTHRGTITYDSAAGPGRISTGFFDAPLGLVWCRKTVSGSESAWNTTNPELVLTFAKGDYKGVMSHSLTE